MTKLCARGKAAAKRKFKVYPSAYANAYASKICAGKIKDPSGTKRKDWGPKKASTGDEIKVNPKSRTSVREREILKDYKRKNDAGMTKKANKGLLANTTVSPSITAESGVEGKINFENKGIGLSISNEKLGRLNLSKTNRKESMQGFDDLETKSKNINYNKSFKIGKSSSFNINLNKGKSSNNFGNTTKTKGGTLSLAYTFNKGSEAKIKKVAKGLHKASALHKKQAKSLDSITNAYQGKFIKHDSGDIKLSNKSSVDYYGDLLK